VYLWHNHLDGEFYGWHMPGFFWFLWFSCHHWYRTGVFLPAIMGRFRTINSAALGLSGNGRTWLLDWWNIFYHEDLSWKSHGLLAIHVAQPVRTSNGVWVQPRKNCGYDVSPLTSLEWNSHPNMGMVYQFEQAKAKTVVKSISQIWV